MKKKAPNPWWIPVSCIILFLAYPLGCGKVSSHNETGDSNLTQVQRISVLEGLAHPWSMAFLSATDALVTEKDGGLKRVDLSAKTQHLIKGLPPDRVDDIRQTDRRDNAGLFEVLVDPNYEQEPWVYLSYAARKEGGTTTKVVRGQLLEDSLINIQTLLVAEPYSQDRFHYGGGMVFGGDGKLYITIGERYYNEIDQPALPVAQDVTDQRGMIYRIHRDGSIPTDNPSMGDSAVAGAYAIGIRAVQGLTLHPQSGEIWFTEHGSQQGDEVNLLRARANYGWPVITDGSYRNAEFVPPKLDREYTAPAWSWKGTVAPTGLVFYTGDEFPAWKGSLFVAGLSSGSFWRLTVEGAKVLEAERLFEEDPVRLRKVTQGPDGKLYVLTDEPNGRILQVISIL